MTGAPGHPASDAHLSRLRELIHDLDRLAPIARLVEAEFVLIEPGRVKIRYSVKPEFMHPGRAVQGGIVTVYADMAMAMAGQTLCRSDEFLVTSQLSISFLAPVTRGPVLAEGLVVKRGRMSYFLEAAVRDTDGLDLARATSIALAKTVKR